MDLERGAAARGSWMALASLAALAAAGWASPPLPAAEPDPVHPSLRACTKLWNNAERLACFDRAIARLDAGDAAAAAPTAEELFGIDAEAVRSARGAGAKREQIAAISARVAATRRLPDGSLLIELDNGQAWRQMDAGTELLLEEGDAVKISRGALATFRLVGPTGRFARVRRER